MDECKHEEKHEYGHKEEYEYEYEYAQSEVCVVVVTRWKHLDKCQVAKVTRCDTFSINNSQNVGQSTLDPLLLQ